MVGYVSAMGVSGARSPIWGIYARRALWSLNSVCCAVVEVGGSCCAIAGILMNQWSRGVLFGVYVGVRGSPKCFRCVFVRRSARGLEKDTWCGEFVAYRSPPSRTGACACSDVKR